MKSAESSYPVKYLFEIDQRTTHSEDIEELTSVNRLMHPLHAPGSKESRSIESVSVDLDDSVADRVEREIGDRVQIELAH